MSTVGGLELPELISNILFRHLTRLTSSDSSFEPTSDVILGFQFCETVLLLLSTVRVKLFDSLTRL